jgi:hypothetical protein
MVWVHPTMCWVCDFVLGVSKYMHPVQFWIFFTDGASAVAGFGG